MADLDPAKSTRRTKLVLIGVLVVLLGIGWLAEPAFTDLFKVVVMSP